MMNYHGKVVLEDGSPPGRRVGIDLVCEGVSAVRHANASPKTGVYFLRLYLSDFGAVFSGGNKMAELMACHLEAVLPGYNSTKLDMGDRHITGNPELPNIVLTKLPQGGALVDLKSAPTVPRQAGRAWERALRLLSTKDWAAAEDALRSVIAAAPQFAPAWAALGAACQNQRKTEEAGKALARAVELDPKRLPPYSALASVQIELRDWSGAAATSEALIAADTAHDYLEAYLDNAIARFQQRDFGGALRRVQELIRLDKRQEVPRAEYILGIILEAKGELDEAAAHMHRYLDQNPQAKDAAAVTARLANLGKQPGADLASEVSAQDVRVTPGEAPVPGGIKAFSFIARIPGTPTYQDFFLRYCRAITSGTATVASPTAEVGSVIRTFVATMSQFERVAEREGDRLKILLATDTEEHRERTRRAAALLGWRLKESGGTYDLEPGDQPIDEPRQRIPAAFGIDELDLRATIAAGRPFEFEIPIESARLVGGAAWSAIVKVKPQGALPQVEVFLWDWRFARVYAGLASMDEETAATLVSAVGLVPLITRYPGLMAEYSEAIALRSGHIAVPGGVEAEPAWAKLAGASPARPHVFLRTLLEKDNGVLMAFFYDLWRADIAHQRYMTATPARAEAFYRWYRDSALEKPLASKDVRWQATILQKLRLGASGSVELPGGRQAWTASGGTDDDVLLGLVSLEPVAALIRLEDRRRQPLDQESAALLARHYQEWRYLFPYFEKLPGLGAPQLRALAAFAARAATAAPAQRALAVGEWHSLVELMVLAIEAGSLDASRAADAFTRTCDALRSANPSGKAVEILRALAGARSDVDESVASGLLRLSGAKREAFERVKELQGVPRIAGLGSSADPTKTLHALAGTVYAAMLDPSRLLVAEDPLLLAKHDFLPLPGELFADSGLVVSDVHPGSNLTGGFGRFREVAWALDRRSESLGAATGEAADPAPKPSVPAHAAAPPVEPIAATESGAVFRTAGRIVEVYATVTDNHGRYVDDLTRNEFTIHVEGQPARLFAFENRATNVSVVLLLDTTSSMSATLPSLKRAAMSLIDELRSGDAVAVYGFNDRVTQFQPFTTDKTAAKKAVLRAHAAGTTALYDALLRVNSDLAQRHGKKVIIVFSDGDDNASMLTAEAAIQRGKSRGVPIYTVAQGEALLHPRLVSQLANLSESTGGASFLIRKLEDIPEAFKKMSADLQHGYLLAFQPPPDKGSAWHRIAISLSTRKGLVIRAREGYFSVSSTQPHT